MCGGPLPNQVLLSRWFDAGRGKAMGIAYLGIGIGGALVPLLAYALTQALGWRGALRILGVLMIVIALPGGLLRARARGARPAAARPLLRGSPSLASLASASVLRQPAFYLLALGSMASIGAVGGTMQNLKLYLSLDRGFARAQVGNVALARSSSAASSAGCSMGWLADRWPKKHVMLLIYAIVAASHPAPLPRPERRTRSRRRLPLRHRPRRRLHDHPADGGRAVRPARAGPA